MSRVARDIYRKRLRNALSITGDEPFLQMIWAVNALQTGRADLAARTLQFPPEAATSDIGSRYAIHAWELETLVNQLLLTPKALGPKTYRCEMFDAASAFTNFLRKLENAESSLYLDKINIFNEMHRSAGISTRPTSTDRSISSEWESAPRISNARTGYQSTGLRSLDSRSSRS
jgi:hypothetical protein